MKEACSNCRFFRGAISRDVDHSGISVKYDDPELPEKPTSEGWLIELFRGRPECQSYNEHLLVTDQECMSGAIESSDQFYYSKETGVCRRKPPICGQPIAASNIGGWGIAVSLFPVVRGSEWCGEYQKASN